VHRPMEVMAFKWPGGTPARGQYLPMECSKAGFYVGYCGALPTVRIEGREPSVSFRDGAGRKRPFCSQRCHPAAA
jgi:hypothetical protein